jgi:hypothetical protein
MKRRLLVAWSMREDTSCREAPLSRPGGGQTAATCACTACEQQRQWATFRKYCHIHMCLINHDARMSRHSTQLVAYEQQDHFTQPGSVSSCGLSSHGHALVSAVATRAASSSQQQPAAASSTHLFLNRDWPSPTCSSRLPISFSLHPPLNLNPLEAGSHAR